MTYIVDFRRKHFLQSVMNPCKCLLLEQQRPSNKVGRVAAHQPGSGTPNPGQGEQRSSPSCHQLHGLALGPSYQSLPKKETCLRGLWHKGQNVSSGNMLALPYSWWSVFPQVCWLIPENRDLLFFPWALLSLGWNISCEECLTANWQQKQKN